MAQFTAFALVLRKLLQQRSYLAFGVVILSEDMLVLFQVLLGPSHPLPHVCPMRNNEKPFYDMHHWQTCKSHFQQICLNHQKQTETLR